MANDSGKSLAQLHAKRIDIPMLMVAATGLLIAGLSTPVLHTEKLVFWEDDYSIWSGVVGLYEGSHYGLAALIFFFSIVFPFAKLITLGVLWFAAFDEKLRSRTIGWLKALGRWSMLDVFVVAIVVVITKAGGLLDAEPRVGIYLFAAAILLSLVVTMLVDRVARRAS